MAGQLAAGELDTQQKRKKLLKGDVEELSVKRLAWANLQVSLVPGAGQDLNRPSDPSGYGELCER
ncbi:hypothetical protein ACFYE9_28895 [Rhizobium leguminosarum]|uniref:Uncharacterized protein n=2 Tax=Rhizobium leguminosarum TaxID=384 RepID=A0A154I8M2_RHILE|nr:hypothetical protein [Rhizobium leguminosarum]KZA96938.1 hypothetical protein A4A59_33415 [Rhizobium leguminosarum]